MDQDQGQETGGVDVAEVTAEVVADAAAITDPLLTIIEGSEAMELVALRQQVRDLTEARAATLRGGVVAAIRNTWCDAYKKALVTQGFSIDEIDAMATLTIEVPATSVEIKPDQVKDVVQRIASHFRYAGLSSLRLRLGDGTLLDIDGNLTPYDEDDDDEDDD